MTTPAVVNPVRRLRLLGPSTVKRFRACVLSRLEAWRTDWLCQGTTSEDGHLTVEPLNTGADIPRDISWRVYEDRAERLSIGIFAADASGITSAMLGVELSSADAALPGGIMQMALVDLTAKFLGDGALAACAEELYVDDLEPRVGNVLARVRVGTAEVWLVFNSALVRRMAAPLPGPSGALSPTYACIHAEPIGLSTYLDLGTIRLGELLELKPGDVLVTSTSLGAVLDLVVQAGAYKAAAGHLGQSQGRRALVLTFIQPTN